MPVSARPCRQNGSGRALLINQGLCFVHDLVMLDRRTGIRDGLLDPRSRLLIEIALRQPLVGAAPAYDSAEIQRAMRDGFREIVAQVELPRLMKAGKPPKSRASPWAGRVVVFTFCAAIGSAATLILSASHGPRPYAPVRPLSHLAVSNSGVPCRAP
jgi:hypothetical protein